MHRLFAMHILVHMKKIFHTMFDSLFSKGVEADKTEFCSVRQVWNSNDITVSCMLNTWL